ncbi:MAG: fibronectin type III domain-containing protein, partial [Gemmatimonadota bacterium]
DDNSTNENGFRMERRQGQTGEWKEISTVGPDTTSYDDREPALTPGTEYCYRVVAFGDGGDSLFSNDVACATTPVVVSLACTSDEGDVAKTELLEILTAPQYSNWRTLVGMESVDVNELIRVTEDYVCSQLWDSFANGPPLAGIRPVFFQIGNRYIISQRDDPASMPETWGAYATAVFDNEFNLIEPILQR